MDTWEDLGILQGAAGDGAECVMFGGDGTVAVEGLGAKDNSTGYLLLLHPSHSFRLLIHPIQLFTIIQAAPLILFCLAHLPNLSLHDLWPGPGRSPSCIS